MMIRAVMSMVLLVGTLTALAQEKGFTPRQDADRIPSYELVSIHKTAEAKVGETINTTADGVTVRDANLRDLIAEAYAYSLGQLGESQLEGAPAWAKTQLFEIHAKVDAAEVDKLKAIDKAETMLASVKDLAVRRPSPRALMLQRLLEDRFKLKLHYEQHVMPLYEMTVARSGVKMKIAHPKNPEEGNMSMTNGKLVGDNVPMSFIPAILALEVQRPVEDRTGMEGNYDFELRWTEMGSADAAGDARENGTEGTAPSFYTALQEQLGLKLKPGKGPVWVIVVDHVEMPEEN